jgi:hypothetical protein
MDEQFIHPVTPISLHSDRIHTYNKQQSTSHPPSIAPNEPPIATHTQIIPQNTQIALRQRLIIALHNKISYDCQIFTWTIAQHPNIIIQSGQVQNIHSRTCSSTRGGLIGALQAVQFTLDELARQNILPQTVTLIICSRDCKIVKGNQ